MDWWNQTRFYLINSNALWQLPPSQIVSLHSFERNIGVLCGRAQDGTVKLLFLSEKGLRCLSMPEKRSLLQASGIREFIYGTAVWSFYLIHWNPAGKLSIFCLSIPPSLHRRHAIGSRGNGRSFGISGNQHCQWKTIYSTTNVATELGFGEGRPTVGMPTRMERQFKAKQGFYYSGLLRR